MNDTDRPDDTHIAARNSDSLARLREMFAAVIDLDVAQRDAWLSANVPDTDEREAIERLLAADDVDDGFMETPASDHVARMAADSIASDDGLVGQRIGAFRLTRLLGKGGMAAVFLGERESGDFIQHVAVKLLRRGLFSEMEQRLFRRERQLLAALNHPNIAHLIDGGITDAGIPYLVIEFVDGETITRYAQTRELSLRARLELFLIVCRAVEAAHRSLIVHRDIKPSNIMVASDGTVKLLDFGIAKLVEDETENATFGVFTPDYAAPEQLSGDAVTTATDVHALGVLLHELLLGERPTSSPPRRPSLTASNDTQRRLLRGDLDTILIKALDPEPELRYASASSLADDIGRYLSGLPVEAHAPSGWYRTRKFVQRHRGGVLITALFVLGILVALALAMWQANVARQEAARANAMRDFMFSTFAESEPNTPREKEATVGDVVERAIAKARSDETMNPTVRAELLTQLGATLRAQGRVEAARDQLQWNFDTASRQFGFGAKITLLAAHQLILTLLEHGDLDRARELCDRLLEQVHADNAPMRAAFLSDSANIAIEQTQRARALTDVTEAVRISRTLDDPGLLESTLENLGNVQLSTNDFKSAIATYEELLERYRKRDGESHIEVAEMEVELGRAYRRAGDTTQAEAHIRKGIAIDDAILPKDDWRRASHLNALVGTLQQQRDFKGALDAAIEGVRIRRLALGDSHPDLASDMNSVGWMYASLEDYKSGVPALRKAVDIATTAYGAENSRTAKFRENYGYALARAGDEAGGEAELRHAITSLDAAADPDNHEQALARDKLARLKLETHHPTEALAALDDLQEHVKNDAAYARYWPGRVAITRGDTLLALGRPKDAQDALRVAGDELTAAKRDDSLLSAEVLLLQAQAAQQLGDHEAAATLTAQGRERLAKVRNPPSRLRGLAEKIPEH
jgi:eukaryotic-like serine/threonine-protein kinase